MPQQKLPKRHCLQAPHARRANKNPIFFKSAKKRMPRNKAQRGHKAAARPGGAALSAGPQRLASLRDDAQQALSTAEHMSNPLPSVVCVAPETFSALRIQHVRERVAHRCCVFDATRALNRDCMKMLFAHNTLEGCLFFCTRTTENQSTFARLQVALTAHMHKEALSSPVHLWGFMAIYNGYVTFDAENAPLSHCLHLIDTIVEKGGVRL